MQALSTDQDEWTLDNEDDDEGNDGGISPRRKLPPGWICMKKVVLEEEIQWDYEERCHHVKEENCYTAYKTVFKPQKVSCSAHTT